MNLQASELILNADGSIYHLNLLPEHIADTIITVGDQDRVERVTRHFEKIEIKVQKREFHTQTGSYKGKRITVISTGIGPDNIDIVLNELDALVNIDFKTRSLKEKTKTLDFIRIGTSGSIQEEVPVDSFLASEKAIGLDGILHFYQGEDIQDHGFAKAFCKHLNWFKRRADPYVVSGDDQLLDKMLSEDIYRGITTTNIGFYAPQGRSLRLGLQDDEMNDKISSFVYKNAKITNLEMETSAIYALSKLLGHRALSLNAIIANRVSGEFTKDSKKLVDDLILYTLDKLIN